MAEFNFEEYPEETADFDFEAFPAEEEEQGFGERVARGALKALPAAGAMFGGAAGTIMGVPSGPGAIATGVAGAGLGMAAGESLKNIGEHFLGDEKTREEIYTGPAKAAVEGMTYEMGGQLLGKGIGVAIDKAAPYVQKTGEGARNLAEKFAVNSTGATGAQSAKFSDDAGRELLDRKLVRFGDNADKISSRTQSAMNTASSNIDEALKGLDTKGVNISVDDVVMSLEKKILKLSEVPGNEKIIKQLQNEIDNLYMRGQSEIPLSIGEQAKRNFQSQVNYASPVADKKAAFSVADAFKSEVEKKALAADQGLSSLFTEGKKTYGLLAPVQEAAEKRAATLNQSPFGGLGDIASEAVTPGGSLLRRLASPRISSSTAVTLDKFSKALLRSSPRMAEVYQKTPAVFQSMVQSLKSQAGEGVSFPRAADKDKEPQATNFNESSSKEALMKKTQGSKYGQVLQNAANNGDQSFSAAHFVLSQRDPEYRKLIGETGE